MPVKHFRGLHSRDMQSRGVHSRDVRSRDIHSRDVHSRVVHSCEVHSSDAYSHGAYIPGVQLSGESGQLAPMAHTCSHRRTTCLRIFYPMPRLRGTRIVLMLCPHRIFQAGTMHSTTGIGQQRIAGVLGGMGPAATVDFMARVLAATDAASDQDHIHMIIDHNPQVPDRHAAIAGITTSVGPPVAAMARRLERAGADFLVMVCNTAHAYTEEIRDAVNIPFLSIIDVVMEQLLERDSTRVGVMAAEGCLRARLYQDALQSAGLEAVLWTGTELERFMALVYRIKAGDQAQDITTGLRALAAELEFRGADILVAGCTEIPLFLHERDTNVPLLSSTDLLVRRTIAVARNQPLTEYLP